MSSYLIIKKDNVTIGEWVRSTKMYQAFPNAPYGDEKEFTPDTVFKSAIEHLQEDIKEYTSAKNKYNKMLEGSLSYDERWDCITSIEELDEVIEECNTAISNIYFMIDCWECDRFNENPPKWTYKVS